MGCSSCKEKKDIKEELLKSSEYVSRGIVWFVIIWSLFAVFGIYSFIKLFV